jgi:hypothetical protein
MGARGRGGGRGLVGRGRVDGEVLSPFLEVRLLDLNIFFSCL